MPTTQKSSIIHCITLKGNQMYKCERLEILNRVLKNKGDKRAMS